MVKPSPDSWAKVSKDSARLESISWRKPALVEITLSRYENPAGSSEPVPTLADFTDFKAAYVGSRVEMSGGVRRRFFTFRMGRNIPKSQTDREKQDYQEQWSMNTTLDQWDIQRHPNFPLLRKKYNGSVVREVVVWPRHIQDPKSKEKKVIKNPMFGVRSFFVPQVEVSVEKGLIDGSKMDFTQIDEVGYADRPTGFGFFAIPVSDPAIFSAWVMTEKSFRVAGVDRLERRVWRSSYGGFPKAVYNSPGIQGANFS
jgi:hypothetical protein